MQTTKIEWADAVWNPVTGCSKVNAGCAHCYAEQIAKQFWKGRTFADVWEHPNRLKQPLRWQRPRRVFVNSMGDLFHPRVSLFFIQRVFGVMAQCPQHTFIVLTKRPDRMAADAGPADLPNVILGASPCDQETLDEYAPHLSGLANRGWRTVLSLEPLLGPVTLDWMPSWVIVGAETGPKARAMYTYWARGIRDQCRAAGVRFFLKQVDAKRNRELDGRTWDELPE